MDKIEVTFDEKKIFNSTLFEVADMITEAFEAKGVPINNVGTYVSVKKGSLSTKANLEDGTIIYTWTPEDLPQAKMGKAEFEAE